MNLTFLQTFLTVIETGNLNKAADRLHVTQSTVTARLDALEEALGRKLLVRSRKGTRLTRAGFELRPHADLLVSAWAQARKAINLPQGYSGLFSFACEFDLWHDVGRRWLYATRDAHPTLAYEARPGRRSEIAAWLASGLTDAAMTLELLSGPGILGRAYLREEIAHVAPTAGSGTDHIHIDHGVDFRRERSRATKDSQTASMTFSTSSWALEHMLDHGGTAYLPRTLVEPHLDRGSLRMVAGSPVFARTVYLVWREANEAIFPWIRGEDTAP